MNEDDKQRSVREHDEVELTCTTSASNPSPADVEWTLASQKLEDVENEKDGLGCCEAHTTKSTATFEALREHNGQTYVCKSADDPDVKDESELEVFCELYS